jgi:hypothetical protein
MWKKILILGITSTLMLACDDDDDNANGDDLVVDITGLANLGTGYQYEGWLIVDGNPISTGTFTVNDEGEMSKKEFDVTENNIDAASAFVLTIETNPDSDPMPSMVKLLGGDFSGETASLDISHQNALGNDFSTATGVYLLATPTTANTDDEKSGVWFIDNTNGMNAGLHLPVLPNGWQYEGWAVINGTPVTTGRFSSMLDGDAAIPAANGEDNSAPYSGSLMGPPFPGEDFVQNAPAGLTFPTDLTSADIVITIEPNPDNSPDPFFLKPLKGTVPDPSAPMTIYNLQMTDGSFPQGTVKRE